MYHSLEKRVAGLLDSGRSGLLLGGSKGLEKESLRVSPDGGIAQTVHPGVLGSALTHPSITTDYSEALVEFITPPFSDITSALDFLQYAQKFVYENLSDEILWATSMPCVVAGGDSIPIARYGTSNAGIMKTAYRRGLGHRYGRVMQVIAGVHYNYSFNEALWPVLGDLDRDGRPLRQVTDSGYLALTRNLQRFGWLIPYLFGASPAVCKSFVGGNPTSLLEFDSDTYYEPYATSLRLGDIGYTNSKEKGVGISASYDSLDAYVESLTRAIETPSPIWEPIGIVKNGQYQQLNSNILQIENEYYSSVRPKQILEGLEKPVLALQRRGVRYVELRSLDVNAYHPLGVSEEQLRFLELFMQFCLLHESPPISIQERREIDQNMGGVAHRGRDPSLYLLRQGREIRLRQWAGELCEAMSTICEILDKHESGRPYKASLDRQRALVEDPDLTPSARMLKEMRERGEGFYHFAKRLSQRHHSYFLTLEPNVQFEQLFREQAAHSMQQRIEMEAADELPFADFLEAYFAQQ
ncbi:MAG: glutamate--cysteine ligase [Gammaproteobacteria bacterium]|nr:glutamate--cysteine ligase [Gammaproteobacteria bacterium]